MDQSKTLSDNTSASSLIPARSTEKADLQIVKKKLPSIWTDSAAELQRRRGVGVDLIIWECWSHDSACASWLCEQRVEMR